jgi:glycosyltransferase involved in cell wall biosynthesis
VARVSVIIPAFNAEAHLEETLRSVRSQSYEDWEIVLADDGSSDRTVEIAQAFGDVVKLVRNTDERGVAAARNTSVAASTGELLAFLDADDYWLKGYLEEQVRVFDEADARLGRIGLVTCDARVLSQNGFLSRTYQEAVGCPDEVDLRRLLVSNPIFVSALTTREAYERAGGFSTELSGAADHDLWIRIVELGYRVVVSPSVLAVYRLRASSMSTDAVGMAADERRVYERALERGNLTAKEVRTVERALRRRRAVERISTSDGIDLTRTVRALPLLARVVAENPRGWRSIPRLLRRGRNALSTRFS